MTFLEAIATGAGQGGAIAVTVWALTSARDLLRGALEKRWPETFGDPPSAVDPRELLEQEAWDHFAANALTCTFKPIDSAALADEMLLERRRRYGRSVLP